MMRLTDPGLLPKSHDLKVVACKFVGWPFIKFFRKQYIQQIEFVSFSLVVLGDMRQALF